MTGSASHRSVLPARRLVIGSLLGALATGSLLGLVLGIVAPSSPGPGSEVAATGAPTSATAASTQASVSTSASASPSKLKPIKTITRSPAAVPNQFIQHPENDRSLLLGYLDGIDPNNHDRIVISFRRARIATGPEAQQFYLSQGQQPHDTAVIPLDNAQDSQLALQPDAALWGQFVLGDHQNVHAQQLGLDQFIQVAQDDMNRGEHPPVWIKRSLGVAGDVVYLAEHVVQ